MLSPASHRVCCLAAMAPALTKADRRADCLPVVLPFCDSENRKDTINGLLNKRKTLVHRTWLRATYMKEFPDKTRSTAFDLRRSLLNGKFRTYAENKIRPWHGQSATVAVADKVRYKYTMNKNGSSLKNMGLSRTNMSLGLQPMKRNKVAPDDLSCVIPEPPETHLPDVTNKELETSFRIVRIVKPETSGDASLITADSKRESAVQSSEENISPPPTNSCGSSAVGLSSTDCSVSSPSSDPIVPVTLNSEYSLDGIKSPDARNSESSVNHVNSFEVIHGLQTAESSSGTTDQPLSLEEQTIMDVLNILENMVSRSHRSTDSAVISPQHNRTGEFVGSELDPLSPLSVESRHSLKESEFDALRSLSSSPTLSADGSPIMSSVDDVGDSEIVDMVLPDCFWESCSWSGRKSPSFLYEVSNSPRQMLEVPKIVENPVQVTNNCCPMPKEDFLEVLANREKMLEVYISEMSARLNEYMVSHVHNQIGRLFDYYQKKLSIPCQRQSLSKSAKDLVDLKAEFLQRNNVKNLSTAALVNLVRNMESTTPGTLPVPLSMDTPSSELPPSEAEVPVFSEKDYEDVKATSQSLLRSVKDLVRFSDPDMTESSEEESELELEEIQRLAFRKKPLWKFLKERAALASRSTWLIARIHELENQLRTISDYLRKTSSAGALCLATEQTTSDSPALFTAGSDDASLQNAAVKRNKPKSLSRPVNGCLDHSSIDSITQLRHTNTSPDSQQEVSVPPLDGGDTCRRTMPLDRSAFRKRKLLVTPGLHLTNNKLLKLSTVGCVCNCQDEMLPCILCTGRYNCVQTVDPDTLPLLDRVSLLDPVYHPLLSVDKDVPLLLHFESILKKDEARYQSIRPISPPIPSHRKLRLENHHKTLSRSRKLKRYARTLLSAKYRNKPKHFRKHKLVFGKWRKLQTRSSFQARDRIRRLSIASSNSSQESPIPSPSSFDDGFGSDLKRRRDGKEYDIDNVIIPYSSKRGRLVKFEFKDIEIPSWRSKEFDNLESTELEEETSDTAFTKRHEGYEVEEKKIIRNGGGALCFYNTWRKRAARHQRADSRADSSGANTPDPVLCDQDIMFQDTSSMFPSSPFSPVLSPPATPGGDTILQSDDSQPLAGTSSGARPERRRSALSKRTDEPSTSKIEVSADEVLPYDRRVFPLPDDVMGELLAESEHYWDDPELTVSCPASPESSSSTSTVDEDDDIADPEWTVVKRDSSHDQALVLKFAKR